MSVDFINAVSDLQIYTNDLVLSNEIILSAYMDDFLSLCSEIMKISFPRIHDQKGYTLPQLYQRLYPVMSIKTRNCVNTVMMAWTSWCDSI